MKDNCIPNDFPNFLGKPMPPIPPYVPPVPSVLEGSSLYEAMNGLTQRVNCCIKEYNTAIGQCYSTLQNLYRAGQTNGAYYSPDELNVQREYDPISKCGYTVITKKCVDNYNEPIRMQLETAFNKYQNTGVTDGIWDTSYNTLANIITCAQPASSDGWWGNVIINGICVASRKVENSYSVGFDKKGKMKIYYNNIPIEQMIADGIVNSCGVTDATIMGHEVVETEDTTVTTRTHMGYNALSGNLYIITCDNEGMTRSQMTNIMKKFNVDNAVEICNSAYSPVLNAGIPIYYTDISELNGNLFWYISRKCHYRNEEQRQVAELFQKYGKLYIEIVTAQKKIKSLTDDLNEEIKNRTDADNQLQTNINNETSAREEADLNLQNNIKTETNERKAEDTKLQTQLNNHDTEIDAIHGRLDIVEDDISNINTDITTITNRLNAVISGETRIPYLKATNTNGNTSAYDINMNNMSITNLNSSEDQLFPRQNAVSYNRLINYTRTYTLAVPRPINSPGIAQVTAYSGLIFYRHWTTTSDSGIVTITSDFASVIKNVFINRGKPSEGTVKYPIAYVLSDSIGVDDTTVNPLKCEVNINFNTSQILFNVTGFPAIDKYNGALIIISYML